MIDISIETKEKVNKIVNNLIKYNNENNLSWTKAYKEVIKDLKIDNSNHLLSSVVKELTKQGYNIIGEPFKLEKYK